MALQTLGETSAANPLSFSEIKTEFASSNNSFLAYLKGAGIVDSNDIAPNVPTSPPIRFSNFFGAARVDLVVNLPQYNADATTDVILSDAGVLTEYNVDEVWASAQLTLYANGAGYYRTGNYNSGDTTSNFTWLTSGSASDVYAYLDTPVGSSVTGTSSAVATLLQMNTFRGWTWYVNSYYGDGGETNSATTTLRLKNSANTDLDTVSVSVFIVATNGPLG